MVDVRVSWFVFNVCDLLVLLQCCKSVLGRKKEKISTWRQRRGDPSCQDGMITFFLVPTW